MKKSKNMSRWESEKGRKWVTGKLTVVCVLALLVTVNWLLVTPAYAVIPQKMKYQGMLYEGGSAVTTAKQIGFKVYYQLGGGTAQWEQAATSITPSKGLFSATLDFSTGGTIDWENQACYLEVTVEGTALTPRELMVSTPYSLAGKRRLPATGQTTSYDTGDGDDGYYRKGFNFQDNGDGTITDTSTGLMWPKVGTGAGYNSGTALAWQAAIDWAEALVFAGYTDWRLPNVNELKSFQEKTWGHYQGQPTGGYWSSTTNADATTGALLVYFNVGTVYSDGKASAGSVVACRAGQ